MPITEEQRRRRQALQEIGTGYATNISLLLTDQPSFWEIYEHNISETTHLTHGAIFESLNNGVVIINDPQTLNNYIACFGGHHYQKLQTSFAALFRYLAANATVDIIDYGCGQALATTVLYDYMLNNRRSLNIKNITLIEPSLPALKRGILHLNYFINHKGQNAEIKSVNKMLDDITDADLTTDASTIKIHLFSNILDVTTFDLTLLADKIKRTQKGLNFFICVSPYNPTADTRILSFRRCFNNFIDVPCTSTQLFKKAYNVRTKTMQDDFRITMYQRIFKCNFDNVRTLRDFIRSQNDDDLPF